MGLFDPTGAGKSMKEYKETSLFGRTQTGAQWKAEQAAIKKKRKKAAKQAKKGFWS